MAFNASLEVTILLRSQPAIGERNFILSEKAARRDTIHYSGMERTTHVRYTVQPSIAYDSRKDCFTLRCRMNLEQ